jgi:hypothetical protein
MESNYFETRRENSSNDECLSSSLRNVKIHSQQSSRKSKLTATVVEFVEERNCSEDLGEVLCNGIMGVAA